MQSDVIVIFILCGFLTRLQRVTVINLSMAQAADSGLGALYSLEPFLH